MCSKIYALEHDLCPVYLGGSHENQYDIQGNVDVAKCLKGSYALLVTSFRKERSFAENIWSNSLLGKNLKEDFSTSDNVQIITTHSFTENNKTQANYEEGFALLVQNHGNVTETEDVYENWIFQAPVYKLLKTICVKHALRQIAIIWNKGKELCHLVQCFDDNTSATDVMLPVAIPKCHPAFACEDTNSIYHSLERVYEVLSYFKDHDEVKELLDICNKYINVYENRPIKANSPVVAIEGLDATGKTTLTQNIGKKMKATILKSPPECITHLRKSFDSQPQLIRRAYYSLGNYAFAAMIAEAANKGPVILDRYWQSSAAYAIATDVKVGSAAHIPPPHHPVYSWPSDLLKPDAVFLLTITDEVRRARLTTRNTEKTDEELRLEKSRLFRERLEASYRRMENPCPVTIDASGTPEQVCEKTINILLEKGLL